MSYDQNNIVNFVKFLHKHNITNFIIAAILSDKVNELASEFVGGIVSPVINNENGTRKLEDLTMSYKGYTFKIGRVIFVFMKFVIVLFIVYILARILNKFK